jgi:hypothetical protein
MKNVIKQLENDKIEIDGIILSKDGFEITADSIPGASTEFQNHHTILIRKLCDEKIELEKLIEVILDFNKQLHDKFCRLLQSAEYTIQKLGEVK